MTLTSVSNIDTIEDIEFELIDQGKLKPSNDHGYVNNKEFYAELCKYHEYKMECLSKELPIPPLTNNIGKAIIQIATRRCNSRMYYGYSANWKEEMIGNAIMVATLRGHNFDPSKSDNPFAYFTQICDNAIRAQLKSEKLELYMRYKSFEEVSGYLAEEDEQHNDEFQGENESVDVQMDTRLNYISSYEDRMKQRKQEAKDKTKLKNDENKDLGIFRGLLDIEDDIELVDNIAEDY